MKIKLTNTITSGINKLAKQMGSSTAEAMEIAALALAQDAVDQAPSVPVDTGNLRGSWAVYVNGNIIASGNKADAPAKIASGGKISAGVAFSADYALYQHEGIHFKHRKSSPTPGAKFLEVKLISNKDQYREIIARELAARIKK